MDDLQLQKTNFEIEKLKEEIKEIKEPFWKKATFISSFYLPFIIVSVTYFLNRNYISQSLELKSVQQQLTQIRLDTIENKIKKDSQFIVQEEKLQKLRLESINYSSQKIRQDSSLLMNKQQELMKAQNDIAIEEKNMLDQQHTLQTKTVNLRKRDSQWTIEKLSIEQNQKLLNDSIQSKENRLKDVSTNLVSLTGDLNKAKLIAIFTEIIKPKINKIAENLLLDRSASSRFVTDSIYVDSLFKDVNSSMSDAERYSITIGNSLNDNAFYIEVKELLNRIQSLIVSSNRTINTLANEKNKKHLQSELYSSDGKVVARIIFKMSEQMDLIIKHLKE